MMRSANPALRANIFGQVRSFEKGGTMSIQGTANKAIILLGLAVFSASWAWDNAERFIPYIVPALIAGLIIALVTAYKKEWAYITSPIYALVEGVVLGAISSVFEAQYPGIVIQAVGLTFGTMFCMLFVYKSGLIKVNRNFMLGVVSATGAIFLLYLVNMVMRFFGVSIPFIHEAGPIGIGFSIFVVIIAALNLVLDFNFIEKGEEMGAPRYMEWYGAFALMVTLVWLYIEILRLLAKTRRR